MIMLISLVDRFMLDCFIVDDCSRLNEFMFGVFRLGVFELDVFIYWLLLMFCRFFGVLKLVMVIWFSVVVWLLE